MESCKQPNVVLLPKRVYIKGVFIQKRFKIGRARGMASEIIITIFKSPTVFIFSFLEGLVEWTRGEGKFDTITVL